MHIFNMLHMLLEHVLHMWHNRHIFESRAQNSLMCYNFPAETRGLAGFVDVLICAPVAPKLPAPSNRCHCWPREEQTYLMVTTCSTQRPKTLIGKLALPTRKFLQKTMENALWSSQTVLKASGQPGKFPVPDRLESCWIAKTVQTVKTVSTINKATKPLQTKVCPTAESFIPADYNISISSTGNFVFVWNKLNSL